MAVPPAPVVVSQPAQQEVSDFVEFTGTTEATDSVDVRARVKGFLKKVNFVEGSMVKQGDLLYEIEPDLFQAAVDGAKAAVEAAKARLKRAEADLAIKKEMAAGNAASKLDVITAQAMVEVATADVASTTAALEDANINLGYTKIYAPISGRIDKTRVDAGNLVGADGNTLLANIVQAVPIYVNFDADEATVQKFQARMRQQGIDPNAEKPSLPLQLSLGTSTDFGFKGFIDFVANKVDTSTGTIKVRGILENTDHALTPGFFCRVRVPDGKPYKAVLVPERAIGVDQGQKYVLVVDDKNKVEFRPIEVGSQQGQMRVVTKGVAPTDSVIVEGILRTRPGATVAPQQAGSKEEAPPVASTQP